jgi:putative membrane protein insertion efficiency factor
MRQTLLKIVRNPVQALFAGVIRFYQVAISPGMPGRCKYYPSCSQYALDAVREYGATRGFVLGAWRLLRCNPLSYGGYDPVSRQRLFRPRGIAASSFEAVGGEAMAAAADAATSAEVVAGYAAQEHGAPCTHTGPARRKAHGRHAAHGHLVRG